jgi:choline dehydrogenase-like flavoprotein
MSAYEETDVIVIGAGMGGAAVSKRLTAAGMKVTVLEQGDWVHPTEHPHFHNEWEIERERGWAMSPNVRLLPEDYPITGDPPMYIYNAVGGSTVHYGGSWPRLKPVDFRKGTEHGVEGSIDWPISYEDLAPYYDLNDREMGIAGINGDPANPERSPRYCSPIYPGKLGGNMAKAFDSLGWHWWPSDFAILTRPKDGRQACNACGPCMAGCPRGSLGQLDYSYWPKAIANGVDLRTNARVERINAGSNGLVSGVTYIDRVTDERHEIRAGIVVVAGNSIGTPRMLLMSEQPGHEDGLANSNGLVGTHLVLHSWAMADAWFEAPMEGYKGNVAGVMQMQEFYDSDVSRGFVNGFTIQVGRSGGASAAAIGANGYHAPWGAEHRQFFNEHFAHHALFYMEGEDLPRKVNRVTLDHSVKDSSGLPAAHVHYELHENDRRLAEFGAERVREAAEAVGGMVDYQPTGVMDPPPGWHIMGSCRMGNSPEDSVTNKFNQTWDIPNLFIADASSLTTGGAVNPTSTIGAVALRCAEYIARRHKDILRQTKTPRNDEAPQM